MVIPYYVEINSIYIIQTNGTLQYCTAPREPQAITKSVERQYNDPQSAQLIYELHEPLLYCD